MAHAALRAGVRVELARDVPLGKRRCCTCQKKNRSCEYDDAVADTYDGLQGLIRLVR